MHFERLSIVIGGFLGFLGVPPVSFWTAGRMCSGQNQPTHLKLHLLRSSPSLGPLSFLRSSFVPADEDGSLVWILDLRAGVLPPASLAASARLFPAEACEPALVGSPLQPPTTF